MTMTMMTMSMLYDDGETREINDEILSGLKCKQVPLLC